MVDIEEERLVRGPWVLTGCECVCWSAIGGEREGGGTHWLFLFSGSKVCECV